jgi:hypothetical protein
MMKYLFSFLLTLLVGYGQGQTSLSQLTKPSSPTAYSFPDDSCQDIISFHGKQKAIKEIWPEECVVSIKVPPCIAEDGCPVTSGVPFHAITLESPDVPAIKHEVAETSTDWSCVDYTNGGIVARQKNGSFTQYFMAPPPFVTTLPVCTEATRTSPFDSPRKTTYTCADKSRILLTAEDGKRWCHKPESSPKP